MKLECDESRSTNSTHYLARSAAENGRNFFGADASSYQPDDRDIGVKSGGHIGKNRK